MEGTLSQWALWFVVNESTDWLNISLTSLLYSYDVDSALVGMNSLDSRIQESGFESFLVHSNNSTHSESNCLLLFLAITSSLPSFLLFLVFATATTTLLKEKQSRITART